MSKDLGTYHFHIKLSNGEGFIESRQTGNRYIPGSNSLHPLFANKIPPVYETEEELFGDTVFTYTDGNFACDCNLSLFLDRSKQLKEQDDYPCGNTLQVVEITAERPSGDRVIILKR